MVAQIDDYSRFRLSIVRRQVVLMTSSDGITWTDTVTLPVKIMDRSIAWSPELGLFAMVASNNVRTTYGWIRVFL